MSAHKPNTDYQHIFDEQDRHYQRVKVIVLKMKALDEEVIELGRSLADLGDSHDIETEIGNDHASFTDMDEFIDTFEWETKYLYDEIARIERRRN